MINAKPNLNGNSDKDFFDAAWNLTKALNDVDTALAAIRTSVFHGRNYQHIADWQLETARAGDDANMKNAVDGLKEARHLVSQITDVVFEV